jgi:hypothetical protein
LFFFKSEPVYPIRISNLPTDIPFGRTLGVGYSRAGVPYPTLEPSGMPKLGQYKFLLQTPFFLYRDAEHARAGAEFGGTGFLISKPTRNYPD